MRKIIISLAVAGILIGGYYWVGSNPMKLSALEGVTAKAERGDLIIPINASGNIKPASVTEIKSKASGEVIDIPFDLGAMVKQGDLLVRLLDVDEQRNVDKAESDLARAKIEMERAHIRKKQLEGSGMDAARAKIQQAEARRIRAQSQYDFFQPTTRPVDGLAPVTTQSEWDQYVSAKIEADATKAAAEAELEQARTNIDLALQDIETAQQTVNTSQKALDDAMERLKETTVFSPVDGMVLERNVQKGEVIMSGKTMFGGGTVLMKIADVSQIYAVVNVDEADIGQVRELAPPSARPGSKATQPANLTTQMLSSDGEPVEITVESFKEEIFNGVIERISPQSEVVQAIATFKVWIRITSDNREKLVSLLNTQAEAHFSAKSVTDAVLVDYEAIQKDPNSDAYGVFVPYFPPGKNYPDPQFKPCQFGGDNGIKVEVREGLQPGEEVYVKLPLKSKKQQEAEEKESE